MDDIEEYEQRRHDARMKVEADARRWRYLRDHHARGHSLHMDGTACYSLGQLPRARTLDEAMDAQIAKFTPPPKESTT